MTEVKKKRAGKGDVFIGNKIFMNYVTGVVMQLNSGVDEVCVKARGKYISKAVDVVEVVRSRFIQDTVVKNIEIGSDSFDGDDGRKIHISTIEIALTKK